MSEMSPRQIVARLHAEIAAKSPEHAALVAAFEALPALPADDAWARCRPLPARPVQRKTSRRRLWPSEAREIAARYEPGFDRYGSSGRSHYAGNKVLLAAEFGICPEYVPAVARRWRCRD